MDDLWVQLLLVAALILLNGAFAGTEIALISLREGKIVRLAEHGRAGRTLARLARDPNQFLATIQIGITLANLLASATAAVTFAEPLVGAFSVLGAAARPTAIFTVSLILTFVTLVFGELAPKRIAMQRVEGWSLIAARPLSLMTALSRPAVWLLSHATDVVVRLAGGDPTQQREAVTEEELRDMVAMQPELTNEERAIIGGAFEFSDRTVRQILVPRTRIIAFSQNVTAADAVHRLVETGHSRAPVYQGDHLDDVIGIVHLRALVSGEGTVGDHSTPAVVLPETAGALDSLRTMQEQRQQMAIVINEHGGVEGLVTVEDLIEELVGEIWDESDPDVQAVRRHPDGSFSVVGSYPVHDLVDLGVDAPEGDYTTVAGLILDELGHIPDTGATVEIDGWRFEVTDAGDRVIRRVRLSPVEDHATMQPDDR
jgi:putative hemolysin